MRQEGVEEGGKPRLGPCRERAELGAGAAGFASPHPRVRG